MCLYLTVMCPSIDFEVSPPPSCVITVSLAAPFFSSPPCTGDRAQSLIWFSLHLTHSLTLMHASLLENGCAPLPGESLTRPSAWFPPPTPTRTCRPQNSVPGGSCPTKTAATLAVRLQQSLLMTCNKALWDFCHFRVVVKWPNCGI